MVFFVVLAVAETIATKKCLRDHKLFPFETKTQQMGPWSDSLNTTMSKTKKKTKTTQGTAKKGPAAGATKKAKTKKAAGSVSAAQTILNVTATLARLSGSSEVPRDKMIGHARCEGIVSKSTIANAMTALRKAGLITMAPKVITITEKGMGRADTGAKLAFATNEEYHNVVQDKMKLGTRARKLMKELADGRVRKKTEVSSAIGCDALSKKTWANMLTPLKRLNIIAFDRETIQLTDDMFPFGRPDTE